MTIADEVLRYAAFTRQGRGGNPAGVVLEAAGLSGGERQDIARAVGYSETVFLERTSNPGRFRTRYYSPLAEVAFCGHATIAAAVAFAERHGAGRLLLETLAGSIVVETAAESEGVSATLTSAPTRTRPASPEEASAALSALRWTSADVDPAYPVHVAYGGNDHLVVAVRSREILRAWIYDYDELAALMAREGWDDRARRVRRLAHAVRGAQPVPAGRGRGPRHRSGGRGLRRLPEIPGPGRAAH